MSRWADWFSLSEAEADALRSASHEAALELIEDWLERVEERPLRVEMDKAWEPIHRCLTGDQGAAHEFDADAGDYPLKLCVMGGEQLLGEGSRMAALISAADVPALALALSNVTEDWFRERFFALPDTQFHEIDLEAFEWAWGEFEALPELFRKAASSSSAVICTISH